MEYSIISQILPATWLLTPFKYKLCTFFVKSVSNLIFCMNFVKKKAIIIHFSTWTCNSCRNFRNFIYLFLNALFVCCWFSVQENIQICDANDSLQHPAGTSEISDLCRNISNFGLNVSLWEDVDIDLASFWEKKFRNS